MTWLATVSSNSMVYEIRSICATLLGKLCYFLLHVYYYLNDCGIQLLCALIQSKTRSKYSLLLLPHLSLTENDKLSTQ